MRLGTCIVVELLVGVSTLTALGVGTAFGVGELRAHLAPAPAELAVRAPEPAARPAPPIEVTPPVSVAIAIDAGAPVGIDAASRVSVSIDPDVLLPAWRQNGQTDEQALAPLRAGALVKVKFNDGGSSLSLRLDFDNGARAAFKPEQIHPQSKPWREIAAYRIDRLLGVGRVPPAIGRTFTVDEVVAAIPADQKWRKGTLAREAIARRGSLNGELSWWIPEIAVARIGGYKVDTTDGIVTWRRLLRVGASIPARDRAIAMQLSDMIVFDFLVDNADRWTGNNIRVSPDNRILYFMDNTLAFGNKPRGHRKNSVYLHRVETFSRRLVDGLRALTEDDVRVALSEDIAPFAQLVTDREIKALMKRRDEIVRYVDELIAAHGDAIVLAFP